MIRKILLATIFNFAVNNEMLRKSPVTRAVQYNKEKSKPRETKVISVFEQKKLIEYMKSNKRAYYSQFALVLQTGLRLGELIGLKWSDIDWDERTIHVARSTRFDYGQKKFVDGPPKYEASDRFIPLTNEAYTILCEKKKEKKPQITHTLYHDNIFIGRHGQPLDHGTYEKALKLYCRRAGITQITPHGLRHTFATRCVEAGMTPKNLQNIMGHEHISMTMELYVHATNDGMENDMQKLDRMVM